MAEHMEADGRDSGPRASWIQNTSPVVRLVWPRAAPACEDKLAAARLARLATALLRSLGYRTRMKRVSDDVYYNPNTGPLNPNSRAQAGLVAWSADLPAASNYFGVLFSCSTPNFPHFCDRRIEKQIERALALQSSDSYLANRLWARIDRAVVDEAPVAPLYTVKQVDIVSRRVGNFQYNPQWGVLFGQLWPG